MKLIVGLGNPGKEYENTRHNVGFLVVDQLYNYQLSTINLKPFRLVKKINAEIITCEYNNEKILLVKPQTFMNNSGEAVKKVMDYYKINVRDLYVACDDLDLDLGTIRIRKEGSSGGHKGLQSIIDRLGSNEFIRFRVGIANSEWRIANSNRISAEKYVLQKFGKAEQKIINKAIDKTAQLIVELLEKGLEEKTVVLN